MTERISLIEAYDNRDVIAQLVRLRDNVDELLNILKDIDPNGDLTNVVTKTGDQTIDGVKTFIGKIVADCDIIQNGSAYETHAEQVYSTKDYIVLRDGALGGLSPGDFSGLRVNKYDSVNDGHLVVDRDGVARVGDVGDEQPLMTRDETADMTSGNLVIWDGVNMKAITSSLTPGDISAKVTGSGNIGDDTKPVKIVGGVATAVTNELQTKLTPTVLADDGTLRIVRYGQIVMVSLNGYTPATTGARNIKTGLPNAYGYAVSAMVKATMTVDGALYIQAGSGILVANCATVTTYYGELIYITNDP